MFLSKDQILGNKLKSETVTVPEWGGDVIVREMSARERDAFETAILNRDGEEVTVENVRAHLAVRSVVDEQGNRIFGDDDAEALANQSGAALNRIYTKACRLSRLRKADVEELVKNSGTGPSAGSSSDSQAT